LGLLRSASAGGDDDFFRLDSRFQARRFAAATARRGIHRPPCGIEVHRFNVQAAMRLAFGGQENAVLAHDLLEDRNTKHVPKALSLLKREQRVSRTCQNDHGVGERERERGQAIELVPSGSEGGWAISRSVKPPSLPENTNGALRTKP